MSDETNIGGVNISGTSGGTIQTADISTTITAGGDVVGRDKIFNEITNIVNQALSVAEEAAKAQEFATKKLAACLNSAEVWRQLTGEGGR